MWGREHSGRGFPVLRKDGLAPCSTERWLHFFPLSVSCLEKMLGSPPATKPAEEAAPRRQSGGMGLGDAAELLLQQT